MAQSVSARPLGWRSQVWFLDPTSLLPLLSILCSLSSFKYPLNGALMEMGARRKISAPSTSDLSVTGNYYYQLSTLNKVALLLLCFSLSSQDNTGWSRTNKKCIFRRLWRHQCPLVTEIDTVGYGDSWSTCPGYALFTIAVLLFICSINHIPAYLFLSWDDNDDVRNIGKHDFFFLLHPIWSRYNKVNSSLTSALRLGN